MINILPPNTVFKIPEPLEWGKIHRNCGYCGKTYFHTLLEHQAHIDKCEADRLTQVYGPAPKKPEEGNHGNAQS